MTAPNLRIAALRKVALLAGLAEEEFQFLAAAAIARRCQPGEMIFSEGDACEGLYVVESGSVKVFKVSPSGREQVLTVEGPGDSIAELPVFDGGNYPASAMAAEETVLLLIRKKDIRSLCLAHPEVALKVLRAVSARLRHLVNIVEELSFTTVQHRLAALLVREARTRGRRTARGVEFDFTLSNQEIASHIGTVRELVSRNLSRLQAAGLIHLDGRTVIIADLPALETEVAESE
jgi:CRP-like cAMP-binding protein